jgi:hypothetical protein
VGSEAQKDTVHPNLTAFLQQGSSFRLLLKAESELMIADGASFRVGGLWSTSCGAYTVLTVKRHISETREPFKLDVYVRAEERNERRVVFIYLRLRANVITTRSHCR